GQPTATPAASPSPKVVGGVVEQMEPAPRHAPVSVAQTAGQSTTPAPALPHSRTLPPSMRKAIREGATADAAAPLQLPSAPSSGRAAPPTVGAREDAVAMTPLRKRIAQRLVEAQHTAAILTTFNEVDMSQAMALRTRYQEAFVAKHGIKLGF